MTRPVRIVSIAVALVLGLVTSLTGSVAVAAPAAPVVTQVAPAAGPFGPTLVVVRGRNLQTATAVTFGGRPGVIVRRLNSSAIQVRTPKVTRGATVAVRVRTGAGWSRNSAAARYTFVPAPVLARVSPALGAYTGGQKVTLTGRNLALVVAVTFGTARATIVTRSATKLVVRTPLGVLGATKVRVTTRGGTSRGASFTYVRPLRAGSSTVTPDARTFVPTAVEWVSGGDDAETVTREPWLVGLPQGATLPEVGKPFLLKPGAAMFPSGLVGTVEDVAVQADESVRVTVAPSPLDTALDRLKGSYSGPLVTTGGGLPAPVRLRGAQAAVAVETAIEFPIEASALFCRNQQGQSVAFGADLTMTVTDVDVSEHHELGSLVRRPTFDTTFTAEVKTTGKFHVEGASTCKISHNWAKAHRRVFPLGTTGATVTIYPAFEFSVSGKGTLTVLDRTRTTYAVNAELGKAPKFTKTSRTVESRFGGASSFDATLAGGISVELGLLTLVGVEGKILLGVSVGLEAANGNVCVGGKLVLKLSVNFFLDSWIVPRWDSPALTASIDLREFARACVLSESSPPSTGEPQIASARLPDGRIGAGYSANLDTVDHRSGTWSVVRFALPAGLHLDAATGEISGMPTGPVGDSAAIVDFKDGDGRVATTTIRIRIEPRTGIGGGDVQITLRWTGPADLDLHVLDPVEEEIYYRHREAASGGALDRDANAGCNGPTDDDNAVENVFWPPRSAPAGTYSAFVRVYEVCDGALDWHLTVRRNGRLIIDQAGTGDSPGYTFAVGSGLAAARLVRVATPPVRTYPAK